MTVGSNRILYGAIMEQTASLATQTKPSLSGLFASEKDVSDTIQQLQDEGFSVEKMSVVYLGVDPKVSMGIIEQTKVAEGTALGGAAGVISGGVFGWMAGAGSITVPGTGLLIASGPLLGMLSAAGAVGTAAGLVGALIGLGLREFEAKNYADRLEKGEILLSTVAETTREQNLVKKVFLNHDVQDMTFLSASQQEQEEDRKKLSR